MHVCVMVVTVKMTGRSGESVNAALDSVCVSMGFFPLSLCSKFGEGMLGGTVENVRGPSTFAAMLQHPNYYEITYSREKKTEPNIRRIWERSEKIIQHPLFVA